MGIGAGVTTVPGIVECGLHKNGKQTKVDQGVPK